MGFQPSLRKGSIPMYVAGVEASKEYSDTSYVKKSAPKIRLLVSPFLLPLLPLELVSEDFGGIIQSTSSTKSRNQAHGSFTVVLAGDDSIIKENPQWTGWPLSIIGDAAGISLRDLFKPMSLAQLWVDGYHVMTGYVRVCRKQTSAAAKSRTYTIQFDELGALYTQQIMSDTLIHYGEDAHVINNLNKILISGSKQFGLKPLANSVSDYVNSFLASTLNYGLTNFPNNYLSGSDLLPLAFRMVAQAAPLGGISNSSLMSQMTTDASIANSGGSSFWDFMKGIVSEPFMEMFTESGGRTICTGKLYTQMKGKTTPGGVATSSAGSGAGAGSTASTNAASSAATSSGAAATDILKPLSIPPLNVTPMLPGFNYLIIRTSPYDNPLIGVSPWNPVLAPYTMGVMDLILAGDFVIITDDDVFEKDLGVSDMQQYTMFHTALNGKSASKGSAQGDVSRPSIARGPSLPIFPGGVRTYGNRALYTSFSSTNLQFGANVSQSIERAWNHTVNTANVYSLSTLTNVWFRNASKFNEGTISTRGMPYARPGMVLLYLPSLRSKTVDDPRDIGVYYIDNHSYEYQIGKADRSTFSVIRGTPLPFSVSNLLALLLDWEILPPGLNLFDGDTQLGGVGAGKAGAAGGII